jgi:hypothetical protein
MTYSAEVGSIPGQTVDGDFTESATSSPPGSRPRSNGQVWTIALAFGLMAGLFAWGAEEATYGLFRPQLFRVVILRMPSLQPSRESQNAADIKNATLAFAFLGCLTGLAMGFAGGVAGRSTVRGVVVGVAAMLLGGLIAAGTSLVLLPAFFRQLVPDPSDLLTPIMIHGGIWGAIGALGGLAFAIGMGRGRRVVDAIIGACFGTLLATIVFHFSGEMLFPNSRSFDALATLPIVRLMAMVSVSVLLAVGAVWGTLGGARSSPSA